MAENGQEENIPNLAEVKIFSKFWYDHDLHFRSAIVTAEVIDDMILIALHVIDDGDEITIKKPFEIRDVNNIFANVKTYEEFKEALCSLIKY